MATSESVNGKNLKMFSFEGDFKTRPKVSLGGASKKVSVICSPGNRGEGSSKDSDMFSNLTDI